ncbi:trypsin-zeta, putative [Anopheles sinensis]|uniref:Trypsin-zeta, putative n=1 Tax=Anopheles sinensis TaxID=74873 RepID=A0A084WBW1_ANOSI|nr:trypsin-zeta, putative [Anopheles sinensis]
MAEVGILTSDECRERLPGPFLAAFLTEANICTDNEPTDSSICAGDSGAPVLIATGWRQTYNLLAIASWTVAPCGAGPSVHVRIAPHLDWILGVIASSRM